MNPVTSDPWENLRQFTAARIALGRSGHSLPTNVLLEFQRDHAQARDAVYSELDVAKLTEELAGVGPPILQVQSQVQNRQQYLQRPDWGRRLSVESRKQLENQTYPASDLCIVIADGLSATAVNQHAAPVVQRLIPALQEHNWSLAPLCLVTQGRVAIADEIGFLLHAQTVVILIGERPGLSSPDSMGAYLTFQPRPGLTDESRNCISNIRPAGLPYGQAAEKLLYLLTQIKARQLSGVNLKDESPLLNG